MVGCGARRPAPTLAILRRRLAQLGMEKLNLSSCLQSLTFGLKSSQSMEKVSLPTGLQSFTFGLDLNQNVEKVSLSTGLLSFTYGLEFLPGGAAGRAPSAYHNCPPMSMFHVVLVGGAAMRTRSPA